MKRIISQKKGKEVPLHPFLARGIFYSHKDLDVLLDEFDAGGKSFYLYTGRGPSSASMHLGHLLPFMFTKYLQETFEVPVVIQMTDDEKYLFRDLSFDEIQTNLMENCKDIIACGFDPKKTFIFSNLKYMGTLYPNVVRIQALVTNSQVFGIFGVKHSDNIGRTAFAATQAAPSFYSSFPDVLHDRVPRRCLIPCGIDQDPYFRMTRDIAPRLDGSEAHLKPALIHSKFFPSLQGNSTKMSASIADSSISLNDTPQQIKRKIFGAFSGGQETLKAHRELGANLEVDIPYQMLRLLMEDEAEVERIGKEYAAGRMLTKEVKNIATEVVTRLILRHQEARSQITEETVKEFMTVRPLDL